MKPELFQNGPFQIAGVAAECPRCHAGIFARARRSARRRLDALLCAKCGTEYRRSELMQQILAKVRARAEALRHKAERLLGKRRRPGGLFTRFARARSELSFVETIEDWGLLVEIGRAAEAGAPLSLSALQKLGMASQAIVERRVRRLRSLGLVVQRPAAKDARVRELALSPDVHRAFESYVAQLGG